MALETWNEHDKPNPQVVRTQPLRLVIEFQPDGTWFATAVKHDVIIDKVTGLLINPVSGSVQSCTFDSVTLAGKSETLNHFSQIDNKAAKLVKGMFQIAYPPPPVVEGGPK